MTKSELSCKDVLLQLNTMLANGEILFVCDNAHADHWIQAYAFYHYGGSLYAVTKDFAGIFRRAPHQSSNPFVESRAYFLSDGSIIINIKGEVVATRGNYEWIQLPPNTASAEFLFQKRSDPKVDESRNNGSNGDNGYNFKPLSRRATNRLYHWFRRVFTNKSPASV